MQIEYLDKVSMIVVSSTLNKNILHGDGLSCERVVANIQNVVLNRAKDDRQRNEALLKTLLLMLNDDLLFRKNLLRLAPSLWFFASIFFCRVLGIIRVAQMAQILYIVENILTFLQELINVIFHYLISVQFLNLFIIWLGLNILVLI